MKTWIRLTLVTVFFFSFQASGALGAQNPAEFFKGKVIEGIVPYKTGGGYDAWMRSISPFFKKYSGATMVIKNVPGAGSLVGMNKLYVSDPNGLTIGIVNGVGALQAQLTEAKGVRYDLTKFTWLGRLTAEQRLLYVGTKTKYKTIEAMMRETTPIKIGAPGLGSSNFYEVILIAEALGIPIDLITGYETASEVIIAILRGEVEGATGSYSSVIDTVQNGDAVVVVQYGDLNMPAVAKVPHLNKLPIKKKDGKELLDVIYALNDTGRAIVAPPGVPADRTKFLEGALKKALDDPGFLELAKKQQMEVVYLPGAAIKKVVDRGLGISPALKQKLKDLAEKYKRQQ